MKTFTVHIFNIYVNDITAAPILTSRFRTSFNFFGTRRIKLAAQSFVIYNAIINKVLTVVYMTHLQKIMGSSNYITIIESESENRVCIQ